MPNAPVWYCTCSTSGCRSSVSLTRPDQAPRLRGQHLAQVGQPLAPKLDLVSQHQLAGLLGREVKEVTEYRDTESGRPTTPVMLSVVPEAALVEVEVARRGNLLAALA